MSGIAMMTNCAASDTSVRRTSRIVERLTRIAGRASRGDSETRAVRGLACLAPVDNMVDRLDRTCERRSREDAP